MLSMGVASVMIVFASITDSAAFCKRCRCFHKKFTDTILDKAADNQYNSHNILSIGVGNFALRYGKHEKGERG